MKLELKHLASYLPYGLICKSNRGTYYILDIYSNMRGSGIEKREILSVLNEEMKPILLPLSKYYSEENGYGGYIAFRDFKYEVINKRISLKVYEDLLKNKFDVFGLIDAGLAEPVTEEFNPYK